MKTICFLTLLLLLPAAPLPAQQPGDGPVPAPPADVSTPAAAADDQENAATVDLLLSGPWKVTGSGWSFLRVFNKDGTFYTRGKGRQRGTWKITDSAVELHFMDGHMDTFKLPLNADGTPGLDAEGASTTAVLISDTGDAANPQPTGETEDIPTPPELTKLRQGYVDSLNELLGQYVKAGNTAGAKAATAEINKLSPCGVWKWVGGKVKTATIHPDGTVTENTKTEDKNSKDVWQWIDEVNGKFQINWDSGWVDNITLSPDGKTLTISNNAGKTYTVERLPQIVPWDAGAGAKPEADTSH